MMKKKEPAEQLPKRIKITGIAIPDLYAKLIKRTNKKAMYLRTDGIYEVFRIKIKEKKIMPRGKVYPRREIYPDSEDFGYWAWSFNKLKYAEAEYKRL